eukprot:gi/632965794/ref/XP_007899068.1/ PREDICTED: sushi domain-containing protein 5 [Callorhinchus milii]
MDNGQQKVKTIDVKTETAGSSSGPYDSFCIKDKGNPCGDPPSFPNTILESHTHIEMGDEVLYVCTHGYIMTNKESVFSLLCDSCGEWYGHVQVCMKGDTQGHIDYEDKFPDGDSLSFSDRNRKGSKVIFSDDDEEGEEADKEDDDSMGKDGRKTPEPTEWPVSLLSQKHLFWFPSEAFSETEQPDVQEQPGVDSKTQSDNQIGGKTEVTEGVKTENEEFLIESSIVHNKTKVIKETVASTDESWLDGYPVASESEEEGEKVDGSMETDDETVITTDHSNHIEISRADTPSTSATDYTQILMAPTGMPDQGVKQIGVGLTLTTAPENVSASKAINDVKHFTTTPSGIVTEEPLKSFDAVTEPSVFFTTTVETTGESLHPVDHAPVPTERGKPTTYHTLDSDTLEPSTQTPMVFTEIDIDDDDFPKIENFTGDTEAKLMPTSEPCVGEDCPSSSKGPMIAIIVIAIGLLALASILALWCYKRRHQKTSVYEMNGKGQTRRGEQIEMQQKV